MHAPIKLIAHVFCAAEGCRNQCTVSAYSEAINAVWRAHPWWREEWGGHICGRCWQEMQKEEG